MVMAVTAACVGASTSARGDLVVFAGSSGSLAAEADFLLVGSTLTVTLKNTSMADVLVPTDVLTAVLFNTTHALTPVSASIDGSTVWYGTIGNAGDGWGYGVAGSSLNGGNTAIISTGAFDGVGHSNFSSADNALDGLAYGILSKGDNTATGNSGVIDHGPLIKNEVIFTLTAASGFSLSELGHAVTFQYGTALSDTHFSVPEPTTMIAGALLLLPFGASTLRILRKSRAA